MPVRADRPLVLLDPLPQTRERIFTGGDWERLTAAFDVREVGADLGRDEIDGLLGELFAVVGQTDLPRARLARAEQLQVICNVEGNFYPNVDYEACFERGIYVLGCGRAYADAVAEYALGLAIDLGRGISAADRDFRAGTERYLLAGNSGARSLLGARVGLIGFGHLARALLPMLAPFTSAITCYDPWVPAGLLAEAGVSTARLDELLATSEFIFVLAASTAENEQMLDAAALDALADDARLICVSRAAVFDLDALVERVDAGRFLAAIDVWPDEPMSAVHDARRSVGLVCSAHRAGAMPEAFAKIGAMVADDLEQLRRGLPPMRMQVAARELVGRYRSRPVSGHESRTSGK